MANRKLAEECLRRLTDEDSPTIAQLADEVGVSYQRLYRMLKACGYRPRRTHTMLAKSQNRRIRRLLMQTDFTRRKIASIVGCAKSTVDLRCKRMRRRAVRGAETELRLMDAPGDCPKHGKISVWPCVACAAEKARRQGRQSGERRKRGGSRGSY